jgi:hypothetical protein
MSSDQGFRFAGMRVAAIAAGRRPYFRSYHDNGPETEA